MADTITPPLVKLSDIDIEDLTTKQLAGTGVLDKLLAVMRLHLDDQFQKERIRGPEYAATYLGAYQTTLQAAIAFLFDKEKQGYDLQLIQSQIELSGAQVNLTKAQEEQIRAEMTKIPYEIQQLQAAISLAEKQLEQADRQLELLEAQIQVQLKQLDLLVEQVAMAKAQADYYAQKVITEIAQTDPSVIKGGSVIGVQIDLMEAQTDGYARNAEQQATQLLTNTWNVRRQTDEDTSANTTNLLDDRTVGLSVQQLLKGIGVTVVPA